MNIMIILKQNYIKLTQLVALIILMISIFNSTKGSYYYNNIYASDHFVSMNYALALEQGFKIHENFHTAFGIFYGKTHQWILQLIQNNPDQYHFSDIRFFQAILVFLILSALLLLYNLFIKSKNLQINFYLFLLIISTAITPRYLDKFDHKLTSWEMYNNQMYAFIALQLSLIYLVLKKVFKDKIKLSNYEITILCIFNSVLLGLSFHYKISFFISLGLTSLAFLFALNSIKNILYAILITLVTLITIIYLPIHFWDYSLLGYFNDLSIAAKGKSSTIPSLLFKYISMGNVGLLYFLAITWIRNFHIKKNVFNFDNIKKLFFERSFYIDFIIMVGIILSLSGTTSRMDFLFWFYLAIFIVIYKESFKNNKTILYIANLILVASIITNLFSIDRIARFKSNPSASSAFAPQSVNPNSRTHRELHFSSRSYSSLLFVYDLFEAGSNPQIDKISFKASYSFYPKNDDFLYLHTRDLFKALNMSLAYFKEINLNLNHTVYRVDFADYLTSFLGTKLVSPHHNWVHVGINYTKNDLHTIWSTMKNADFIILPAFFIMSGHEYGTAQNCVFLQKNREHQLFVPIKADYSGTYFIKKERLMDYMVNDISNRLYTENTKADIEEKCDRWFK